MQSSGAFLLLRRIQEHVRDQNWFAIGIDFVIVVLGVFIAAQISNWDQSRRQHALFKESFDRAVIETQTNLAKLEDGLETISDQLPVVQQALEDLRACSNDDEALVRVEAAFAPIGTSPQMHFDTKALDQLINNDSFLPFQPQETRQLLMGLSTRLNTLRQNSETVADNHASQVANLFQIMRPGPLTMESPQQIIEVIKQGAPASPEMVRNKKLAIPLAEACKNEMLLSEFYLWEDMAYYHAIMGGLAAELVRSDLETLGRPAPPKA